MRRTLPSPRRVAANSMRLRLRPRCATRMRGGDGTALGVAAAVGAAHAETAAIAAAAERAASLRRKKRRRRAAAASAAAAGGDDGAGGAADDDKEAPAAASEALAAPRGLSSVVEESLLCPICSEVLHKPESGACGHAFCQPCIRAWVKRAPAAATCPVCRAPLAPAVSAAKGVAARLDATTVTCSCGKSVKLAKARAHTVKCSHVAAAAAATKTALQSGRIVAGAGPAAEALAAAAEGAAGPNRSTFTCPLCPASATTARNLDCNALIEHVRAKHKTDGRAAVCPVCAAMPWGDATYVSRNWVAHVELRHRFEYGTFTAYEEDDDAIMRRVLEESARAAEAEAAGGAAAG